MILIDCNRDEARHLLDLIAAHVPGTEPCAEPVVIQSGTVMVTSVDERFAAEMDIETSQPLVTRVQVVEPGIAELVAWRDGVEIVRRREQIDMSA